MINKRNMINCNFVIRIHLVDHSFHISKIESLPDRHHTPKGTHTSKGCRLKSGKSEECERIESWIGLRVQRIYDYDVGIDMRIKGIWGLIGGLCWFWTKTDRHSMIFSISDQLGNLVIYLLDWLTWSSNSVWTKNNHPSSPYLNPKIHHASWTWMNQND